jgi:hypothetical protein
MPLDRHPKDRERDRERERQNKHERKCPSQFKIGEEVRGWRTVQQEDRPQGRDKKAGVRDHER